MATWSENCKRLAVALLRKDASVGEEFANLPVEVRAMALAQTATDLNKVPKMGDKFAEAYTNGLISAFATPIVNAMSGLRIVNDIAVKLGEGLATETAMKLGFKEWAKGGATLKEAGEFAKGSFSAAMAMREFAHLFKEGWAAGKPLDGNPLDQAYHAIGGGSVKNGEFVPSGELEKKIGNIVRKPTQLGVAIDEAMKGYYRRVKLYELVAKAENSFSDERLARMGMSRDELVLKLRNILDNKNNPTWMNEIRKIDPELYDEVTNFARKQTFQEKPPKFIETMMNAKNKHPIFGTLVAPFIRTPFNIGKQGLENVPGVGLLASGFKRNEDDAIRFSLKNMKPEDYGRAMMGLLSSMVIMGKIDAGEVTLGYSADAREREGQIAAKIPEYGIKIGDTWLDWGRVEPFATYLIAVGEWWKAAKQASKDYEKGKTEEILAPQAEAVAVAFSKAFVNRQFLYGLSTFLAGATGDENKAAAFGKSVAGNILVPPIIAQAARATDPYMRKTETFGDALQNRIPYLRNQLPIDYAAYGGPRENPQYGPKAIIPALGRLNQDKTSLQELTGSVDYSPQPVGKTLRGVKLNSEQAETLDRLSSEEVEKRLNLVEKSIANGRMSDERKKFLLEQHTNKAREVARKRALAEFMQDPDFRAKFIRARQEAKGIFAGDE